MSFSDKEYLKKFGERVKMFRQQKGISQEELANALGYTTANARGTAYKIEQGKIDLSAAKIKQLAQILGISIAELMNWAEEEITPAKAANAAENANIERIYSSIEQLNDSGLEALADYGEYLTEQEKYKKPLDIPREA